MDEGKKGRREIRDGRGEEGGKGRTRGGRGKKNIACYWAPPTVSTGLTWRSVE